MTESFDISELPERQAPAVHYDTRILPAPSAMASGIQEAAHLLRAGELVAFPTETVYGLGANGLDPAAVAKIFEAKGRPQDNPLILHIATMDMLKPLVQEVDETTLHILQRLWPSPLTFIFEKSKWVPDVVTAGGETVAIRMPSNEVARKMIALAGVPIAAPSANRSGRPSPTNARDVLEDMAGRIPLILDGGSCDIGIESTVVDLTSIPPVILRPGFYTPHLLRKFFPLISLAENAPKDGETPKAPGMKYRHYAPKARVTLYSGARKRVVDRMTNDAVIPLCEEKKMGFMVFEDMVPALRERLPYSNAIILSLGEGNHLETMGQRIFRDLRELDRRGCAEIYVVGAEGAEYGDSLMNRLRKSAGGREIFVD